MKYVLGCLLSGLAGGLLTLALSGSDVVSPATAQEGPRRGPLFPLEAESHADKREADEIFNKDGLTAEEQVAVAVYEKVNRSVVNITTLGTRVQGLFLMEVPTEGTGSGTVIDKAGHILTNYHVIEDARSVSVTMFDGKTYDAVFVGADAVNDIAVIRVDAPRELLFPTTFGDSTKLKVGMHAYAIGNPFGLERTLTQGIISSLNRSLRLHRNRTVKSIIQIDAAVNPGNSGGPLLDSHGRLIGVNTAIASKTGQSSGVGFAIPASLVVRVVPELIRHGHVIRPEIGIARVYETEGGLLIAELAESGPAEKAGLRGPRIERVRRGPIVIERYDRSRADLITAVDGNRIKSVDDFLGYIESKRPGTRVVLTIVREGRKVNVPVVLAGEHPEAELETPE